MTSGKLLVSVLALTLGFFLVLVFRPGVFGGSQGDHFARVLALAGILLTVGNFAWDCYKFTSLKKVRELDKAEQEDKRREKVTIKPHINHFHAGYVLDIETINQSDFSVHVKGVELIVKEGESPCDSFVSHSFERNVTNGDPRSATLEPRKAEVFSLSNLPVARLEEICGMPPEWVRLSVSSHLGEIARLEGPFLQVMFRELIKVRRWFSTNPPELAGFL